MWRPAGLFMKLVERPTRPPLSAGLYFAALIWYDYYKIHRRPTRKRKSNRPQPRRESQGVRAGWKKGPVVAARSSPRSRLRKGRIARVGVAGSFHRYREGALVTPRSAQITRGLRRLSGSGDRSSGVVSRKKSLSSPNRGRRALFDSRVDPALLYRGVIVFFREEGFLFWHRAKQLEARSSDLEPRV